MTAHPEIGRAVLALDEILRRPELAEKLRAACQAAGLSWLLDQTAAAADHAHEALHRFARLDGGTPMHIPTASCPDWVRLGMLTALITWSAGKSATCLHSPDPMRPQPVIAAAWRPGLVVCSACEHLLSTVPGSRLDRTCDGCGRVVAGPENGDPMYPIRLAPGAFVYMLGTCTGCRYWE